jgi:transglycosylase-like protein with SLT domain
VVQRSSNRRASGARLIRTAFLGMLRAALGDKHVMLRGCMPAAVFAAVMLIRPMAGVPAAAPAQQQSESPQQELCRMVDTAAQRYDVPASFLTRVLWQESRFRTDVTSRAGAAGVAQFMPGTAAERGLADPYDPGLAIEQAARLLAELAAKFGNLGLAAAAYNAGAGRVGKWLQRSSGLPTETQLYVLAVTGRDSEAWRDATRGTLGAIERGDCLNVTADLGTAAPRSLTNGAPARMALWQVRLDEFLAKAVRLQQQRPGTLPISSSNRAAESLCDRIRAMGSPCAVYGR